jgi:hypothetical protein
MNMAVSDAVRKIEDIAALAGCAVQRHENNSNLLLCRTILSSGRMQLVYLHPAGQTMDGREVVCFVSPCLPLKNGILNRIQRRDLLDLLEQNGQLLMGHFAIQKFGDVDALVVRSTQILDTMEIEEFKAHLNFVACIADQYERAHGNDVF